MGLLSKPCTHLSLTSHTFLQREGGSDHTAVNGAELSVRNSTACLGNKILTCATYLLQVRSMKSTDLIGHNILQCDQNHSSESLQGVQLMRLAPSSPLHKGCSS